MKASTRCSTPALLMLLVALGTATHAYAQPTSTDDAAARAHFSQGQALSTSGDFAGAYREFEAGYKANPRPAFLFNMGEAARGLGDAAKARAAYERFLAVESTGALADTARTRLVELGPVPPPQPAAKPPVKVPPPSEVAARMDDRSNSTLVDRPEPADKPRPLWKKWPFWAAVGGVVVASVVVGVVATRGDDVSCGAGCVNFR